MPIVSWRPAAKRGIELGATPSVPLTSTGSHVSGSDPAQRREPNQIAPQTSGRIVERWSGPIARPGTRQRRYRPPPYLYVIAKPTVYHTTGTARQGLRKRVMRGRVVFAADRCRESRARSCGKPRRSAARPADHTARSARWSSSISGSTTHREIHARDEARCAAPSPARATERRCLRAQDICRRCPRSARIVPSSPPTDPARSARSTALTQR